MNAPPRCCGDHGPPPAVELRARLSGVAKSRVPCSVLPFLDGGDVPSKEANAVTKREWRELGFFYDRDERAKRWRIVGSASGVSTTDRTCTWRS